MDSPRPQFAEIFFDFKDEEVPDHEEIAPTFEGAHNYPETFTVFSQPNPERRIALAIDIPDPDMAFQIARARVNQQQADFELYGYSDPVYIQASDGSIIPVAGGSDGY